MMLKDQETLHKECTNTLRPVRDALDILNGKWRLPIIISLGFGKKKRFTEIAKDIHGITDRMLSKELRDLELNGLVVRIIEDEYPVKVTYSLTPHSKTLNTVIDSLKDWGVLHRKKINQECKERKTT